MEHLLLQLGAGFIRWLNRRSQKPLPDLVVDYPSLIRDPDRALREHPIHIGGARRHGSVLVGTFLVWMIVWGITCAGFLAELEANPAPGGARPAAILFLAAWVGTPFASWFAVKRFLGARAGSAVLNRDGVTLASRKEIVFCPWELFATSGNVVRTGSGRILVPVASEQLAGIVIERDGNIDHSGNIQTRLLTYKSGDQIALRQLYEVDVAEMAEHFLHVGRSLVAHRPVKKPANAAAASEADGSTRVAWPEAKGWIGVYVSRLSFAPQCCGCGAPTNGRQVVLASSPFFRQAIESADLQLSVPVCSPCLHQGKRRGRARLLSGLALAVLLFFTLTLVTLVLAIAAPGLAMVIVVPTIFVPVVVGYLAVSRRRRAAAPVEARRWLPGDGTVQLRFRWREYGEALVAGRSVKALASDSTLGQPDHPEGYETSAT
jgi:hypothetical protein